MKDMPLNNNIIMKVVRGVCAKLEIRFPMVIVSSLNLYTESGGGTTVIANYNREFETITMYEGGTTLNYLCHELTHHIRLVNGKEKIDGIIRHDKGFDEEFKKCKKLVGEIANEIISTPRK